MDANFAPETCASCDGTGKSGLGVCNACHAQGSILVAHPEHKCPICEGSGNSSLGACKACNGGGWANRIELYIK
jgi:DnaJ-class molecular chaperone